MHQGGWRLNNWNVRFGSLADIEALPHHVRFGSKADIAECETNVRFTPESRHWDSVVECPLCAKNRHSASQRKVAYSITSSAVASSASGMVNPIAFAVLRLMASSNFVACSTGKSAGFAPLKILST